MRPRSSGPYGPPVQLAPVTATASSTPSPSASPGTCASAAPAAGRVRGALVDALVAAAFVPVAVADKLSGDRISAGPLPLDIALTAAVLCLLALRRTAPVGTLLASCAVLALPTVVVHHDFFVFSHLGPLLVGTYTVARLRGTRAGLAVVPAVWATIGTVLALEGGPTSWSAVWWCALPVAAALAGRSVRRSAQERAALGTALDRLAAERAGQERLAVQQERSRLALELHDVVASAVSVMTTQAAAARRACGTDRAAARGAVLALEEAGRAATAELRSMLGLLRAQHEPADGDPSPPVTPAPPPATPGVPPAGGRTPAPRLLRLDVVAALLLLGAVAAEYAFGPAQDGLRFGPAGWSPLFSCLTVVPVAFRRRAPVTALCAAVASVVLPDLVTAVWVMFWTGSGVLVFLLYTVARHRPGRVALGCLALPVLAEAVQVVDAAVRSHRPQPDGVGDVVFIAVVGAAAAAVGWGLRRTALRRRRLALVLAEVEAAQADHHRLLVLDERRGLARDLHDLVAHAVSLMVLQAGAARLALDDDPPLAGRFLAAAEDAGRTAAGDLAALVRVLHGPEAGDDAAPAGLAGLDELAERVRAAGLDLDVVVTGTPPALPRTVDEAAFRIVQEALTNTLKHAGPTGGRLEIGYGERIELVLTDEGPRGLASRPGTSGFGLAGMRERAERVGGRPGRRARRPGVPRARGAAAGAPA